MDGKDVQVAPIDTKKATLDLPPSVPDAKPDLASQYTYGADTANMYRNMSALGATDQGLPKVAIGDEAHKAPEIHRDAAGRITQDGSKNIAYGKDGEPNSITWENNGKHYSLTKDATGRWLDQNDKASESVKVDQKTGSVVVKDAGRSSAYTERPDGTEVIHWNTKDGKPAIKTVVAADENNRQDVQYDRNGQPTDISVFDQKSGKSTEYYRESNGAWTEQVDGKPTGRHFERVEAKDDGSVQATDLKSGQVEVTNLNGSHNSRDMLARDTSGRLIDSGDKHIAYGKDGEPNSITWENNGKHYSLTKDATGSWLDQDGKARESVKVDQKTGNIDVKDAGSSSAYTERPDGTEVIHWNSKDGKPAIKTVVAADENNRQDVQYDGNGQPTDISVSDQNGAKSTEYHRESNGTWTEQVDGKPTGRHFDQVVAKDDGSIEATNAKQKMPVVTPLCAAPTEG